MSLHLAGMGPRALLRLSKGSIYPIKSPINDLVQLLFSKGGKTDARGYVYVSCLRSSSKIVAKQRHHQPLTWDQAKSICGFKGQAASLLPMSSINSLPPAQEVFTWEVGEQGKEVK